MLMVGLGCLVVGSNLWFADLAAGARPVADDWLARVAF